MPWWQRGPSNRAQDAVVHLPPSQYQHQMTEGGRGGRGGSVEVVKYSSIAAIAKAFLVSRRRRLHLTPAKRLYFLYEPGKQVSSSVKIKNTSRSPVAFKLQTNAPKSCFMRPPCGILAPGETVIATVVKFIEPPEQNQEKKCKDKFKIVSLKAKQGLEFNPELFEEQKEFVAVERVLQVVFLDPQSQSPEIEKLKKRLAEAEAAQQAQKKPLEEKVQKTAAAGGVLDEWKEQQREKQLSKQQPDGSASA
eukprot:c20408_g2_i1 orf=333-1079(-)